MKLPIYIMLLLLAMLSACDKDNELLTDNPEIVIEGWIENGGFPIVILTQTLPISEKYQQVEDLSENLLRWAKVTVSDGKNSIILTGKYDKGYFPPYVYTSGQLRGIAGETYTLTVDYRNYHAVATTTIPTPPQAVQFNIERCVGSDTLYQIKAHFADCPNEKNYYQFFTRVGTKNKQFLASYLGSIDDNILASNTIFPVYRGHELVQKNDYTPYFTVNDTVAIKFAQVDRASYEFWDDYTKNLSLSGNMFFAPSSNIRSNIRGGFGYWCGYGAITEYFIISDYAK